MQREEKYINKQENSHLSVSPRKTSASAKIRSRTFFFLVLCNRKDKFLVSFCTFFFRVNKKERKNGMGQHNTVPTRELVPGVNTHANPNRSPGSLKAPVPASHIKSQMKSTPTNANANALAHEPCVFRVPSIPYANSKVEMTSEVPTACSIQLPNSRGLVFEDVFVYRNSKDQIVFTSGDRRTLESKLPTGTVALANNAPTVSSPLVVPAVPSAGSSSTVTNPTQAKNTGGFVKACSSAVQAPFLFAWNRVLFVKRALPGSNWKSTGLYAVATGLGVSAVAIYFA